MTPLASALTGTWRLERWEIVYDDGRPPECPLGEDAEGFLIYTADGYVSASLRVRGGLPSTRATTAPRRAPSTPTSAMPAATWCATGLSSIASPSLPTRR